MVNVFKCLDAEFEEESFCKRKFALTDNGELRFVSVDFNAQVVNGERRARGLQSGKLYRVTEKGKVLGLVNK